MKTLNTRLITMGAALGAAALLSACHDDHAATPAASATTSENFSEFAKETFAKDENSTPVNFDKIDLVYDVDTDPTAFDSLLM